MSVAIRSIVRVQDADDAPSLGAGQDGYALTYDHATEKFVTVVDLVRIETALIPAAASVTLTPGIFTVAVTWTYTPVAPITGYQLYRKTGEAGAWALLTSPSSGDTSYDDDTVAADTTYYYRLDAVNTYFTTTGVAANTTTETADYDFTAMSDGALPSEFEGSTWAIATGKAVNTPTSDGNVLTDPGLEAAYSSGLCTTLTKIGSPTVAESADAHGGSKAQAFTPVAINNAVTWANHTPAAGRWYRFSVWAKRTASNTNMPFARLMQTGSLPAVSADTRPFAADSYTNYATAIVSTTTNVIMPRAAYTYHTANYASVLVDDGALEALTTATLYALLPATTTDIVAKAILEQPTESTWTGVVVRASGQTNPDNCVLVMARQMPSISTFVEVMVVKKIGSTYSQVLTNTSAGAYSATAWLEARMSGSTLKVYYNNTQRGGDLTISDAELSAGAYHGVFSTGGNAIKRFFSVSALVRIDITFAGSSFSAGTGYRTLVYAWMTSTLPDYDPYYVVSAASGMNSWNNLVRLSEALIADPDVLVIDHANDAGLGLLALEAYIRRVWTANSATKIVLIEAPTWLGQNIAVDANVLHPTNEAQIATVNAIADHYGIVVAAYWEWCKSVVPGTYHLNQLTSDTVHPSSTGYTGMAALVEAYLPDGGTAMPSPLPARLYDCADFEHDPVVRVGTDYDARSGAGWSDDGTAVTNSTPGDTITWTFTGRSFGCYRADATYPAVELSIDGGAFASTTAFFGNGYDIGNRAAHTVVVRVLTSVRIEQFWII